MGVLNDAEWQLATFDDRGLNHVVRSLSAMPSNFIRAEFDKLIVCTWSWASTDLGMPPPETYDLINEFQDLIDASLDADEWALEAATITGGDVKEWRFYTPDPDQFIVGFSGALASHAPFPVELQMFDDPEWNGLAELLR